LYAVGQVAGAAAPGAQFGAGVVSVAAYVEHGAEALAYLVFAGWVRSATRASIRTRFVMAFAALLVVVVLALASALTGVISANVQGDELNDVGNQVSSTLTEFDDQARSLKKDVAQVAQLARDDAATGGDLQSLAEQAQRLDIFDFDFVIFMLPNGQVVGYSGHGPTVRKGNEFRATKLERLDVIEMSGSPVIDDIVKKGFETSAGPTRVGGHDIAVMAVHVITAPQSPTKTVAIAAAGTYIDALTMEDISQRFKPSLASLVVGGKTVASMLPRDAANRKLVPDSAEIELQTSAAPVTRQTVFGDKSYASAYGSIAPSGGAPIGILVLSSPARVIVHARQGFTSALFIVAMSAGAIALALAWFSGRRITQPIQALTAVAGEVREGNLDATASVTGDDEVGRLGETFNEMTASLARMTGDLRDAARQEHELRSRIETIMQSMADGLVAVGAERKILAFNREAENMTGISASVAMGRPLDEVFDVRDSQGQSVTLPIYDLAPGSVDGIFIQPEGEKPLPVTVVSAPLTDEQGDAVGGVLVMRDMSREREVERMKTEFLSNISHELRTPLTPIKGYAEILGRKDIPPEKAEKFVHGILESTARLERIVQLLVDFSAMEAGRLEPHTKAVDISAMVDSLAEEWAGRTDRHDVIADVDRAAPMVVGDERLLRRSLEEVIDNAVKFSPYGGTVRLEVKPVSGNGHGDLVEVSVSDEGIGIPPEDISRIFSDFHQLDGSETRAYGGLGLGLAFVQRIVEAHDGTVRVESRPTEGTRFTIAIPAAADN
ncbi:MAG TPA: ATP-binding protein, partial [Actinomycetota bacterium]|nr:ATP-binding protein [Actinomycetota bacterium]